MRKICINAGHTETYPGVIKNGYSEYPECIKIVDYLIPLLAESGIEAIQVQGTLIEVIHQINEIKPDCTLSLHLGNTNSTLISGSQSFFHLNSDESKKLSDCLLEECIRVLGVHNCGSWIGWFKKITPKMVSLT